MWFQSQEVGTAQLEPQQCHRLSTGPWTTTSARRPPFPHLHSDQRNSQDSVVSVSELFRLRMQHVDAVEKRLLARWALAIAQAPEGGGPPGSESFEPLRFAASGCPSSPGSGRGRLPAALLSARLQPGRLGPSLPAPLLLPQVLGWEAVGQANGVWKVPPRPREAQRGAGSSGKFQAQCACEGVGVGRITWGWELGTQGGLRCWRGWISGCPGKSPGGGTAAEGARAGRRSRVEGEVSQGPAGIGAVAGRGGGHICEFVGAGDRWPGEPWCPEEDRQGARSFYQRSNLGRL